MYGYIGRIQRSIPYSPPSSQKSFEPKGTPDLVEDSDTLTSPSSTSSSDAAADRATEAPESISSARPRLDGIVCRAPSHIDRGLAKRLQSMDDGVKAASSTGFDSLQDLLERAGYKETRIVTPDRQSSAAMAARSAETPRSLRKCQQAQQPTSPPSSAAASLRQTIQRNCSDRHKTAPVSRQLRQTKSSGWLFGAFWRMDASSVPSPEPPRVPAIHVSSEPNESREVPPQSLSLFHRNTGAADEDVVAAAAAPPSDLPQHPACEPTIDTSSGAKPNAADTDASRIITPKPSRASPRQAHARSSPNETLHHQVSPSPNRILRKQASKNQLWMGSVAYRQAKSQTAPVRAKGVLAWNEGPYQDAESFAQQLDANRKGKKRTGLAQAFAESPTKSVAVSRGELDQDPARQRQWRNERAAWRESLQGLQDFSRRAQTIGKDSEVDQEKQRAPEQSSDKDVALQLLAGPALPFLSIDPAVALSNETSVRPSHLRRMKSVEVLAKALSKCDNQKRGREVEGSSGISRPRNTISIGSQGSIAPVRLAEPPQLMISSPSGIHSPKVLELSGTEFEPRSWSPIKGQVIISSRKVVKRSRSKQRLTRPQRTSPTKASESATPDTARGRSKSTHGSSPSGDVRPREPGIRANGKTSAASNKVSKDAPRLTQGVGSVSSSTVAVQPRKPAQRQPFSFGSAANAMGGAARGHSDDPFSSSGPISSTMKKKAFMQSLSRGSKIAQLIQESNQHRTTFGDENDFPAAGIDSPTSRISANRKTKTRASTSIPPLSRRMPLDQGMSASADHDEDGLPKLSSSLSKDSAKRMEAITAALREGKRHGAT